MYNRNFQEVFELERQGRAFVFAPSASTRVKTYTMDEQAERVLYDLGLGDFAQLREKLQRFLNH